jgi:hypothetical protein
MVRPQVADEGTDSNMETNCECIAQAVANGRQRGSPPARGLSDVIITPYFKILPCYGTFQNSSDLADPLVRTTQEVEIGHET